MLWGGVRYLGFHATQKSELLLLLFKLASFSFFFQELLLGFGVMNFSVCLGEDEGGGEGVALFFQSSLRRLVDRQPWLSLQPGGGSGD